MLTVYVRCNPGRIYQSEFGSALSASPAKSGREESLRNMFEKKSDCFLVMLLLLILLLQKSHLMQFFHTNAFIMSNQHATLSLAYINRENNHVSCLFPPLGFMC